MPENKSKTMTAMQKTLAVTGIIAGVAGGITGFKTIKAEIVDFIHVEVHKAKEGEVQMFKDTIVSINTRLDNHINEKSESFAVGLRVHTENNQLYYRAEDGREYPAYKDLNMSNTYNYPYYYYINPTTGEREWCK